MRKWISIVETLQPTTRLAYTDEGDQFSYDFHANGRKFEIIFREDGDDELYTSFTGEDERGKQTANLLGHNKPFSVFSGVMAAICKAIHVRKPDAVWFTVADHESQRISTYDRLLDAAVKRGMMPEGYVWDRDGNGNYWIFVKGWR